MSARSQRKTLFIIMGVLLLLIALMNILDDPDPQIGVITLFAVGGISLIFFNTRK